MVEKILAVIIGIGYISTIGIMLIPEDDIGYKVRKFFKGW